MDGWVVLLATLGPALAQALYKVSEEILVKPLLEPASEQFKAWVQRGYRAREDDARVQKALERAVQEARLDRRQDGAPSGVVGALRRLAEPGRDELRRQTLAAALAMTQDAPEQVTDGLLRALDVPQEYRADLARFLWAFRRALAEAGAEYRELITLAHQDAVRDHLWALASTVVQTPAGPAVQVHILPPEEREIEERYLRSLVESECRFLPLGGRDPRDSTPGVRRLRLENVYIALNTTGRPPQARGQREEGLLVEAEEVAWAEPFSALRVFLDHRCLVLLGEPGGGKTTFASHLALCLAGERWKPGEGWASHLTTHDAAWEGPVPLPIWVRLRQFAADATCLPSGGDERGRAEHLLAYIEKILRQGRYGERLPDHALACLDRGDALLVLDGLDEVGDPDRRVQVAQAINDLAGRRCPNARLLVTCRVRQYPLDAAGRPTADWALPAFHPTVLADFDGAQIGAFIAAWFGELCETGRCPPEWQAL